MSNIRSLEEVLQIKPHCELAWINRMKNHLKKNQSYSLQVSSPVSVVDFDFTESFSNGLLYR